MTEITENTDLRDGLPEAIEAFVLQWGDLGGKWGVNRSISQIHALLYLADKPMTADEVAETLDLARSNVSNSIKELLSWNLIRRVPVRGDRRDHFEAETDVWEIASRIAAGRKVREIDPALETLRSCVAKAEHDDKVSAARREKLQAMLDFTESVDRWHTQMLSLPQAKRASIAMTVLLKAEQLAPENKCDTIVDSRFQTLLSEQDWLALPAAVRRRFSKRVKGGESTVYVGEITQMRMSRVGRIMANVLRLIGAPLPLYTDVGTPSIVSVTEDAVKGGQIWTRLYANRHGFPQMVHSAKRFSGETGLEEYIGFGVSMSLKARAVNRCLQFESAGYVLEVLGKRVKLPRFLTPLDLVVRHQDAGNERFIFSLDLRHPWLGELMHQSGLYREEKQ